MITLSKSIIYIRDYLPQIACKVGINLIKSFNFMKKKESKRFSILLVVRDSNVTICYKNLLLYFVL